MPGFSDDEFGCVMARSVADHRREQIERQKRIAELELAAGWLRMTREQA